MLNIFSCAYMPPVSSMKWLCMLLSSELKKKSSWDGVLYLLCTWSFVRHIRFAHIFSVCSLYFQLTVFLEAKVNLYKVQLTPSLFGYLTFLALSLRSFCLDLDPKKFYIFFSWEFSVLNSVHNQFSVNFCVRYYFFDKVSYFFLLIRSYHSSIRSCI